jgi:hypothetical protein
MHLLNEPEYITTSSGGIRFKFIPLWKPQILSMKFAVYMAFRLSHSFIFFGSIFITVYKVVCCVCFCLILWIICFYYYVYVVLMLWMFCFVYCFIVLFRVLFVSECIMYYEHQVSTQLQLTNISCHIISNTQGIPHSSLCVPQFLKPLCGLTLKNTDLFRKSHGTCKVCCSFRSKFPFSGTT